MVTHAIRKWALDNPHRYALIYGLPVPGYKAPQKTIEAAAATGEVLIQCTPLTGIDRQPQQHALLFRRHLHLMTVLPPADNIRPAAAREQTTSEPIAAHQITCLPAQRSDPASCGDHTLSVPDPRRQVEDSSHLARLSV